MAKEDKQKLNQLGYSITYDLQIGAREQSFWNAFATPGSFANFTPYTVDLCPVNDLFTVTGTVIETGQKKCLLYKSVTPTIQQPNPNILRGKFLLDVYEDSTRFINFSGIVSVQPSSIKQVSLSNAPEGVYWNDMTNTFIGLKEEQYYNNWVGAEIYAKAGTSTGWVAPFENILYKNENMVYVSVNGVLKEINKVKVPKEVFNFYIMTFDGKYVRQVTDNTIIAEQTNDPINYIYSLSPSNVPVNLQLRKSLSVRDIDGNYRYVGLKYVKNKGYIFAKGGSNKQHRCIVLMKNDGNFAPAEYSTEELLNYDSDTTTFTPFFKIVPVKAVNEVLETIQ